ncbi:MAG: TonB-dependent receptor, partial [Zoogloeaceae bacterium]|nr:TonB-dependent receptor [Zoogloeaceae bacterium]
MKTKTEAGIGKIPPFSRRLALELSSALSLMSLMGGLPAMAQEQSAPTAVAGTPIELETVTVTVRRREEDSQRVPASVSSVRGDDLADKRISQVQDLQQVLPSANAAFMHARVSAVAVRGIGNNPASEALEGSVGLYVDNVYYARPGMLAIDLVDLEQVDLLRGPQGTLFGKNTTGGVLSLTTKKPTFSPERSISLSAGNRGYYQALLSFSGPLSDTLAARLSLSRTHDDGWLKNVYNGQRSNSVDREGFRAQALWKPNGGFDLRVIADYNHEDDSQGTMVPYGFVPATALRPVSWSQVVVGMGGQPFITDPEKHKVNFDAEQGLSVYQGGLSAEANWHLSNGFDVTSVTAWRNWIFHPRNDPDYTALDLAENAGASVRHKQFSQELRLASPKGERFDYVLGAYYYWQKISSDSFLNPGTHPFAAYLPRNSEQSKLETNSYALFAQGNWHLTPRLDLGLGLRGTYEIKKGSSHREAPTAWDSGKLTVRDFSPSGLFSLSYRFSDRFLGYTLLAYGEKSGGVNPTSALETLGTDAMKIKPEKAGNFEVGFKSDWLDRRLQVNSNLFIGKIKDYQTTTYVTSPASPTLTSVLTNAGDVKTWGLEFDVKARPIQGLSLSLNGSYNHARYTRFGNAPCALEIQALQGKRNGDCDLSGEPLAGAPEWIVNLGGRYDWFVGEGVSQYLVANYAWRSEAEGNLDNSRYARIPAYGLLNLAT